MKEQKENQSELIAEISLLKQRVQELEKYEVEHQRAEEQLRESRHDLLNVINFIPDSTLVIDRKGKVIVWNRAMETMTGVKAEEMLGQGNYMYALPFYRERRPLLIDLALNPDRRMEERYSAIQRDGDILSGETSIPGIPLGEVHLSATASVLRNTRGEITAAIECIRDNTERKKLQERLNRAEKMEGLGRLAGGVAHDLNNVLGVLVGYSELLAEAVPDDSPLKKYAKNIVQSAVEAATLVQDFLTLAGREVIVAKTDFPGRDS